MLSLPSPHLRPCHAVPHPNVGPGASQEPLAPFSTAAVGGGVAAKVASASLPSDAEAQIDIGDLLAWAEDAKGARHGASPGAELQRQSLFPPNQYQERLQLPQLEHQHQHQNTSLILGGVDLEDLLAEAEEVFEPHRSKGDVQDHMDGMGVEAQILERRQEEEERDLLLSVLEGMQHGGPPSSQTSYQAAPSESVWTVGGAKGEKQVPSWPDEGQGTERAKGARGEDEERQRKAALLAEGHRARAAAAKLRAVFAEWRRLSSLGSELQPLAIAYDDLRLRRQVGRGGAVWGQEGA